MDEPNRKNTRLMTLNSLNGYRLKSVLLNHFYPDHNIRMMLPHAVVVVHMETNALSIEVPDLVIEDAARQQSLEGDEAYNRAVRGVTHNDVTVYSDDLLLYLLKKHDRERLQKELDQL